MTFRPPIILFAFTFAILSGVLLAAERYVAGAILGVIALLLYAARLYVDARGKDDDRFTIW
jgi:hypothetical protein